MTEKRIREHVGWLIWCVSQGYVRAEDREGLTNWLLEDDSGLHPADVELKAGLLAAADEVLARLAEST